MHQHPRWILRIWSRAALIAAIKHEFGEDRRAAVGFQELIPSEFASSEQFGRSRGALRGVRRLRQLLGVTMLKLMWDVWHELVMDGWYLPAQ